MEKLTAKEAIKLTIGEIYRSWYEPEKTSRRRANTMRGYRSSFELHVLPRWEGYTISEITQDDVQAWVDAFPPTNPGGCEKAYKCLRQIINWAVRKWGLFVAIPTMGVELPRKPAYKPEVLTTRRLKKLIRGFVGAQDEPTVILETALGLRPGENYYICWERINWRTGLVPIKGTLQQIGVLYEYQTKTAKSERELYLPTWALDRLHAIWVERGRPKGRVIGDSTPSQVAYRIKRWIKQHRLPQICMKNLRHTWGTIAAMAGNPIETVASMMGHTNIQTCYRYYYQLTTAAIRRAQRKVARSILGKTCDDMYKDIPMPQIIPLPKPLARAA